MSYQKFHYIQAAVKKMAPKLDLQAQPWVPFSLAYLAAVCDDKARLENETVGQLITSLVVDESHKDFLTNTLKKYEKRLMADFAKVEKDELIAFMEQCNNNYNLAGNQHGESFGTPTEIAQVAAKILAPSSQERVADFCYGGGNFSLTLLADYPVGSIEGFELAVGHEAISEMVAAVLGYKLQVHGFDLLGAQELSGKFDKIFCDMPFCMSLNKQQLALADESWGVRRWRSEYLFIKRVIDSLAAGGRAVITVPLAVLSAVDNFMKNLVDRGYLQAVIQFAKNLLPSTGIPFALLVLSFGNKAVKLVNGAYFYTKMRNKNMLSAADIEQIMNGYTGETAYAKLVDNNKIASNNYSLNPADYFFEKKITLPGVQCRYVPFGELCSAGRGVQYKADYLDENGQGGATNCYYATANSVKDGHLAADLPTLTKIEPKSAAYCLQEGDIVLANICLQPLKVAVIKNIGEKNIIASSTLYIIRLKSAAVLPEYIKILLESEETAKIFELYNRGAMSIAVSFLNSLEIPVISMEEQKRLVARYEELDQQIAAKRQQLQSLEEEKAAILSLLADKK